MRTHRTQVLAFPFLLMLTLAFLVACGSAASPTATPDDDASKSALVEPSTLFNGCEFYSRAQPALIPTVFSEPQLMLSPFYDPEKLKLCPIPLAIPDENQGITL